MRFADRFVSPAVRSHEKYVQNGGDDSADEVTLDALVANITDANRHAEVDTGAPAGNESW